jgi:hypothetical protein
MDTVPDSTNTLDEDEIMDDGPEEKDSEPRVFVGKKTKRITEKDRYAIIVREMADLSFVNKNLYDAVNDYVAFLRGKQKPQPKGKAADIIRNNQLNKTVLDINNRSKSVENTEAIIERYFAEQKDVPLSQIVAWIRIAGNLKPLQAIIIGTIIDQLMADLDKMGLVIELMQPWCDLLVDMQNVIDAPKGTHAEKYVRCVKDVKKRHLVKWAGIFAGMSRIYQRAVSSSDKELKKSALKLGLNIEQVAWNRFQLEHVEGYSPDSLYDIAVQRAQLAPWQQDLIGNIVDYCDPTKSALDLLVDSSTSSGKTTIMLSCIDLLLEAGYHVVYLAVNEMLALQSAAYIHQTSRQAKLAVYTESIAFGSMDCNVWIMVPGYAPDAIATSEKMLLAMDECHAMFVSEVNAYRQLFEMLAPAVTRVVALSATISNKVEFQQYLETQCNRAFRNLGTKIRPICLRYYTGTLDSIHPWQLKCPDNVLDLAGCAPMDLETVWDLLHDEDPAVAELLNTIPTTLQFDLPNRIESVSRLDRQSIEQFEAKILEKIDAQTLKQVLDGMEDVEFTMPDIAALNQVLKKAARTGTVVVFTPEPIELFMELSRQANFDLAMSVPFWDTILTINREFVRNRDKLQTEEYFAALEKRDSGFSGKKNGKGAQEINEFLKNINKAIEVMSKERIVALESIYNEHGESSEYSYLIREQMELKPEAVSDHYQPYAHLRYGKYAAMSEIEAREIIPTLFESHCRFITNGVMYLPEYNDDEKGELEDVETDIKILQAYRDNRFNILLAGGHKISHGVNLPISTVVIYDPVGQFTTAEIAQMIGRAGRKGIDRQGRAVFATKERPLF